MCAVSVASLKTGVCRNGTTVTAQLITIHRLELALVPSKAWAGACAKRQVLLWSRRQSTLGCVRLAQQPFLAGSRIGQSPDDRETHA